MKGGGNYVIKGEKILYLAHSLILILIASHSSYLGITIIFFQV